MCVQVDKEKLSQAIELLTFDCNFCPLYDFNIPCAAKFGCLTEKSCQQFVLEWLSEGVSPR